MFIYYACIIYVSLIQLVRKICKKFGVRILNTIILVYFNKNININYYLRIQLAAAALRHAPTLLNLCRA